MSEDKTTQTVVDDAKSPAEPGGAASDARTDDDLDTLLAQYDDSKPKSPQSAKPEPKAGTDDDVSTARAEVLMARDEIRNELFNRDMRATIDEVRGDLPADLFDDNIVRAWIDARAVEDPRLAKAWAERQTNPQKFQQVKQALSREFANKYGKLPDKQATEDREAVAAAVRGASTKAPEGKTPDFRGMSNAEYREAHKQTYGYYPNV